MPPHRILTLTPNPNLDHTLTVAAVRLDEVLRAVDARVDPGGKGFNVARALNNMGVASRAVAFLGGAAGARLGTMMAEAAIAVRAVPIANETRSCYVVTDAEGMHHLKVNEPGPFVSHSEVDALLAAIAGEVQPGDLWVLAGSLPQGVSNDLYAAVMALLHAHGALAVLDASGEALRLGVRARPFLIKPNAMEAGELLGVTIDTAQSAARAALQLCGAGVEMVAVSLGADGLVLARGDACIHALPPAVQARNSVGAGDATVAGMLWALTQALPLAEIARWGVACGTAAAMRPGTDFGSLAAVTQVAEQVQTHAVPLERPFAL